MRLQQSPLGNDEMWWIVSQIRGSNITTEVPMSPRSQSCGNVYWVYWPCRSQPAFLAFPLSIWPNNQLLGQPPNGKVPTATRSKIAASILMFGRATPRQHHSSMLKLVKAVAKEVDFAINTPSKHQLPVSWWSFSGVSRVATLKVDDSAASKELRSRTRGVRSGVCCEQNPTTYNSYQ